MYILFWFFALWGLPPNDKPTSGLGGAGVFSGGRSESHGQLYAVLLLGWELAGGQRPPVLFTKINPTIPPREGILV